MNKSEIDIELIRLQSRLSAEKLIQILKKYIDYHDTQFDGLPSEIIEWSSHDFEKEAENQLADKKLAEAA